MLTPKFNSALFLSFEILNNTQGTFFSGWKTFAHPFTADNETERQLADLFYQLDGGRNFFETCLFLETPAALLADFEDIENSPINYSEFLPAILPENWDFNGWKKILAETLGDEKRANFYLKLDKYFELFQGWKTIFNSCNKLGHLPIGSFLKDTNHYFQISAQNAGATFLFDGIENFAIMEGYSPIPLAAEQLPAKILEAARKARSKFDEKTEEAQIKFAAQLQKMDAKEAKIFDAAWDAATKFNDGLATKAEKDFEKSFDAATKELGARKKSDTKKTESQTLLALFNNLTTFEDMKNFLAENQRAMDATTDRAEAKATYLAYKAKFDAAKAATTAKDLPQADKIAEPIAIIQDDKGTEQPTSLAKTAINGRFRREARQAAKAAQPA